MALAILLLGAALCAFAPNTADAQTGIHAWSGRTYYNQKTFDRTYVSKDKSKIATQSAAGMTGIKGKPGCKIKILKLGICGDADTSSGSVKFAVSGSGGAGFSFESGRGYPNNDRGSTYATSTTYRSSSYTNYDKYHTMTTAEIAKHTFAPGASVTVKSEGTNDYDCLKCRGTGFDGIAINDGDRCGTFRALIQFEYQCSAPCKQSGFYRKKLSDANSCTKCAECKAGSSFETAPCVSTSEAQKNRECKTCTASPSKEHFSIVPCLGTSDAVYTKCKTCGSNEYELQGCAATRDRMCLPHAAKCDTKTHYEATPATKTSDRLCLPRTKCVTGQFQVTAGDPTTDALCKWLQPACVAPLQYEIQKPTGNSDRKCGATKQCTASEYETLAATATTDRKCGGLQTCKAPETETKPATATSDRECGRVTCFDCPPGQYETRKCNDKLKVEVTTLCAPCSICDEAAEVMAGRCQAGQDTKCVAVKNAPSVRERGTAAKQKNKPGVTTDGGNVVIRAQLSKSVVVDNLVARTEDGDEGMDVYQELVSLKLKYQGLQEELRKYTDADQQ